MCMDLNAVIDEISESLQDKADAAQMHRGNGNISLALYLDGFSDGLHYALRLIDILQETKKAAMPASTAADPQ